VIGSRVARPVRDLARSIEFYRDRLGLQHAGGFCDHDGYDGAFFALPGGGELELTAGPIAPSGRSDEDLLVLYVADRDALRRWMDALDAAGVRSVPAANPYWNRMGMTVLDPDGCRVVLAIRDRRTEAPVETDWHDGDRTDLGSLFELAEDSATQLAGYLQLGRVLVARRGPTIVGHLQLVPTETADVIELKNMAVLPEHRHTGVGRALVDDAVRYATRAGYTRMIVATAAADVGNLRFYQRTGFRMRSVDTDAFTPETGYPDPIVIDGIELRDRVWFARELSGVQDA
jgi:GNAT superfamily N-acetyltransferase